MEILQLVKKFLFGSEFDWICWGLRYLGDFYELELQALTGVRGWNIPDTKGGGPCPRESHTAVAHSGLRSSRLYVFGGMEGGRLDDLWQLDLSEALVFTPFLTFIL